MDEPLKMRIPQVQLVWEVPSMEQIVAMCNFRDSIVIATDHRVYMMDVTPTGEVQIKVILPEGR